LAPDRLQLQNMSNQTVETFKEYT